MEELEPSILSNCIRARWWSSRCLIFHIHDTLWIFQSGQLRFQTINFCLCFWNFPLHINIRCLFRSNHRCLRGHPFRWNLFLIPRVDNLLLRVLFFDIFHTSPRVVGLPPLNETYRFSKSLNFRLFLGFLWQSISAINDHLVFNLACDLVVDLGLPRLFDLWGAFDHHFLNIRVEVNFEFVLNKLWFIDFFPHAGNFLDGKFFLRQSVELGELHQKSVVDERLGGLETNKKVRVTYHGDWLNSLNFNVDLTVAWD